LKKGGRRVGEGGKAWDSHGELKPHQRGTEKKKGVSSLAVMKGFFFGKKRGERKRGKRGGRGGRARSRQGQGNSPLLPRKRKGGGWGWEKKEGKRKKIINQLRGKPISPIEGGKGKKRKLVKTRKRYGRRGGWAMVWYRYLILKNKRKKKKGRKKT